MSLISGTRRCLAVVLPAAAWIVISAAAQSSVSLTEPMAPLLPQRFGQWKKIDAQPAKPAYSLSAISKAALAECGLKRSETAEYQHDGRDLSMEAMQFADRTGAVSAFTLAEAPGMKQGAQLGAADALGMPPDSAGAVLFTTGASLVLANFGSTATAADIASLKPLAANLPKIAGNEGVAPLLPTLVPSQGLVQGSVRYALGPQSYTLEGGVLPPVSLDWNRDLEAVTAQYDDARGKETLTLLLYPTPTIAESSAKTVEGDARAMQSSGQIVAVHREGVLLMVASGSFPVAAATQMLAGIHLKEMTFNQDVQPAFPVVAKQTFSLLTNIAILSGILMAAAVLLGLFLGVGRATFRVLRGKPAAVEPEFLSLHLSPQSKRAQFGQPGLEQRD
jgi:hypothetical protein